MIIYRAMHRDEYNQLVSEGFEATFKRKWKYFTLTPEYICVIFSEPNYGLCPQLKYHVAVEFNVEFTKPLEYLVERDIVHVYRERKKYITLAMSHLAPYYIKRITWRRIDPKTLPCPEPYLVWRNRRGIIRRVYRRDKALTVLRNLKHPERIIYINPALNT